MFRHRLCEKRKKRLRSPEPHRCNPFFPPRPRPEKGAAPPEKNGPCGTDRRKKTKSPPHSAPSRAWTFHTDFRPSSHIRKLTAPSAEKPLPGAGRPLLRPPGIFPLPQSRLQACRSPGSAPDSVRPRLPLCRLSPPCPPAPCSPFRVRSGPASPARTAARSRPSVRPFMISALYEGLFFPYI